MYAGDFKASAAEAGNLLKEDPNYFMAYLPLAMEALSRGDVTTARTLYTQMGQVNARAASLANIGLADIDILEGLTQDAIGLLSEGIKADIEAKSEARASVKRMAIAEALDLDGNQRAAEAAAREAVAALKTEPILVPAGRIFAAGRRQDDVDGVVQILANEFEPQKRAYARIIDALDYMGRKRYVDAVDSLKAAIGFADLWLARFYLGVAYEIAGRHTEALDQFGRCEKRRGEATALFIDEVPTYRYLAPLPYWMARAQAGLGQVTQAKANYEAFLAQRKGPARDPLVADARAAPRRARHSLIRGHKKRPDPKARPLVDRDFPTELAAALIVHVDDDRRRLLLVARIVDRGDQDGVVPSVLVVAAALALQLDREAERSVCRRHQSRSARSGCTRRPPPRRWFPCRIAGRWPRRSP